jgi:MtN3 and saliva related transmembrane protein
MDLVTALGLVAGSLTTIAFLPQLVKTWKTKSAEDISSGMLISFCMGLFLWLIYGFCIRSLPVIIANAVTLVLAAIILFFKFRFE